MKNIFDKATTKKYEVEGFLLNTKNISKFCDVFFQKIVEDTLLQKKNFKIPYIILNGEKIEKFARRTNFMNVHGVNRLRDILRKMGIEHELRRMGAENSSIISIAGNQFELVDSNWED